MRLKIKFNLETAGIFTCMIFLVLTQYQLFYFFSYGRIFSIALDSSVHFFRAMLAIFLMVYIRRCNKTQMSPYGNWVYKYSNVVIVTVAVICFYSILKYPAQPFYSALQMGGRYIYPVFCIPFMLIFAKNNGPSGIIKSLNIISFCWYIYIIAQRYVYGKTGTLLFSFSEHFYNKIVTTRGDSLRVGLGTFGNIMILYNFCRIYCKKRGEKASVFCFINFILGFYCAVRIAQTRVMILVLAICIAAVVLCYGRTVKENILRSVAIVIGGIFLYSSDYIREIIGTLSSNSIEYYSSHMARSYAISYYLDLIKNHPIFGYAFAVANEYSSIVHGSMGLAHASDVGLIGLFAETGFVGAVIFYIWPLLHIVRGMKKIGFMNVVNETPFLFIMFMYLIGTSATLIITDDGRIFGFPFVIALFEYGFSFQKKRIA